MKKILIILIGLLLVVDVVSAIDCQYIEQKQVEKSRISYYINETIEEISPPFIPFWVNAPQLAAKRFL